MSAFLRLKRKEMEDGEPNLVPIMNMFLVIIPFLLMSASFYHIKAVNTSIPVLSSGDAGKAGEEDSISLTVVAEFKKESIRLSVMSDRLTDQELQHFKAEYPTVGDSGFPIDKYSSHLKDIKAKYPKSETLILIPDNSTDYETIIRAMDMARKAGDVTLFPNVVLSGSAG
ncbi:MAG: biopolymer transporter ExbD [Desulfatiglans sp.]|jgi:biopolymer transport protein ExbD|nr:biopolymer transporter ExbD [Desulfatiglans sp.]